ncbi:MAG: ABC transporter ATP-binding protein [Geodermatophilaceae bacterium]|nr:ABC transporter ATP-binding protein [Geodermatophilaceae bacterium]
MTDLECRRVTREFPGGAGVHGIDITVAAGKIHALVGLNGAGKTTLMRLMLGMLRPDHGEVFIGGRPITQLGAGTWSRVGHVVGHPLAYPELKVRANLALAARLHGVAPGRTHDIAEEALTEFVLKPYADKRIRVLSSGNLQRVGLAIALQHRPDVVVLDEPTNALDPSGVLLLREVLLRRAAEGTAVLVSSHHLDEVARIADRITMVNRGRVVGELDPGSPDIERAFFAGILSDDEGTVTP